MTNLDNILLAMLRYNFEYEIKSFDRENFTLEKYIASLPELDFGLYQVDKEKIRKEMHYLKIDGYITCISIAPSKWQLTPLGKKYIELFSGSEILDMIFEDHNVEFPNNWFVQGSVCYRIISNLLKSNALTLGDKIFLLTYSYNYRFTYSTVRNIIRAIESSI